MSSTVKDVMSTHVFAVRQRAPYKEMAAMLHEQRVSAFPVLDDDNKVIGIVSEADLLAKVAFDAEEHGALDGMLLRREHDRGNRAHRRRADDRARGPSAPTSRSSRRPG